jgi:branched-chain amino acid transport system substrate-binding protein
VAGQQAAQKSGEIRMTRLTTFGLALGLSAALAGHASAQVKFAVGGPITGGSAAFGAQIKQGVEQAVEDINAAGGILGQKIVIAGVGDDRADPKEGVSVANKFAADGVKFVIGHFNSGVTIPASEVYQENGILEISPAATNPKVTERGMWNIFRVCGRDDQQGGLAGSIIARAA